MAVASTTPSQITKGGHIGQANVVAKLLAESTKKTVSVTKLVETSIPTSGPSNIDVGASFVCAASKYTCVCKRFRVVHGLSMTVEEVTRSLNYFVTNSRVEVTNLDVPVTNIRGNVSLRHSPTVSATMIKAILIIPTSGIVTK